MRWTTAAVLIEIGNALSSSNRSGAAEFIDEMHRADNAHIANIDSQLLQKALQLYRDRNDKTWGLTDCLSFVVMSENALSDALTADHHFIQAGFNALLVSDPS
jgi:uncharacterized protein